MRRYESFALSRRPYAVSSSTPMFKKSSSYLYNVLVFDSLPKHHQPIIDFIIDFKKSLFIIYQLIARSLIFRVDPIIGVAS